MSEYPTYAFGPPPAPPPTQRRPAPPTRTILLVVAVLLLVSGAVVTTALVTSSRADASGVVTEPAAAPGVNPFLPPVAKAPVPVTPPSGTGGTFPGNTPGLYGGTLNNASCDAAAMVAFLQNDPAKAAAWAAVQGIAPAEIPGYVAGLTPVVLRSDTLVTNHGYRDGRATTLTSVLQAGTAVLVDRYGVPRTRCYCGNPLTPPVRIVEPVYTGPTWPGFAPASITIVQQTTVVIEQFTLVDVVTNQVFVRPPGPDVTRDTLTAGGAVPPSTAPVAPPTVPPGTPPVVPPPVPPPVVPPVVPPAPQTARASGTHVLTQSDGGNCSFSDAPRITGTFTVTVAPDGSLTGQMSAEGSGTRDLTCGDMGGRMSWHQRYTASFAGSAAGGTVNARGTLHNVNTTSLSGCTNAGHPVACTPYGGGPGDYPITITGSFDAATGRGRGSFTVGGVDRRTVGTWSVG